MTAGRNATGPWVRLVRFGVPGAMVVGGIACAAILQDAVGVGIAIVLVGGGLLVAASAWVIRLGLTGNADREAEERAREEFSRTGVWRTPPSR